MKRWTRPSWRAYWAWRREATRIKMVCWKAVHPEQWRWRTRTSGATRLWACTYRRVRAWTTRFRNCMFEFSAVHDMNFVNLFTYNWIIRSVSHRKMASATNGAKATTASLFNWIRTPLGRFWVLDSRSTHYYIVKHLMLNIIVIKI